MSMSNAKRESPLAQGTKASLAVRGAVSGDVPFALDCIRGLAAYVGMSDDVTATREDLEVGLFGSAAVSAAAPARTATVAEALVAELDGSPAGLAIFFHSMSTFLGLPGIYLEDLYVDPAMRGRGVGAALLAHLAGLAVRTGCGRLEWNCEDSNDHARSFYLELGAVPMSDWVKYRLAGRALAELASRADEMRGSGGGQHIHFRRAGLLDAPVILEFIRELAEYEHLLDQVTATPEALVETLFVRKVAEVVFAEVAGQLVGFVLYFRTFSTFMGQPCIYLEDLYVRPAARGQGVGKALLAQVARLAVDTGCGRLEWGCLDWNKPAIDFYLGLGAVALGEGTIYRLAGSALAKLAGPATASGAAVLS